MTSSSLQKIVVIFSLFSFLLTGFCPTVFTAQTCSIETDSAPLVSSSLDSKIITATAEASADSSDQKAYRTVKPRPRLKRSVSSQVVLEYSSASRINPLLPIKYDPSNITIHYQFPSPILTCLKTIVLLT